MNPRTNPQGNLAAAYLVWIDASGSLQTLVFDCVESEDWDDGATVTEHPVEVGVNVGDNVRVTLSRCALRVFATNEPIGENQWTGATLTLTPLRLPTPKSIPNVAGLVTVPEWESFLELRVLAGTAVGLVGGAIGGLGGNAALGSAVGSIAGAAVAGLLLNGQVVYVPTPTSAGPSPRASSLPVTVQVQVMDEIDDFVQLLVSTLLALKDDAQLFDVVGTKQSVDDMVIEKISVHRDPDTGTGASVTLGFKEVRVVETVTVPAPAPTLPRAKGPVSGGNQNTSDDPTPSQSSLYTTLHGLPAPAGG